MRERISLVADWREAPLAFDAAVLHGGPEAAVPLERPVTERSLSLHTAAAGGHAGLMAIE